MNRRLVLRCIIMAGIANILIPQSGEARHRRRCRCVCPTQVCIQPSSPNSEMYASPERGAEWNFRVPAKHLVTFKFVSNSNSKRYNFFQLIGPGNTITPIPILQSSPVMHRIPRESTTIDYALRAWAQVPGTSTVTRSDIEAEEVSPNREWKLTVRGAEGKDLIVSLFITETEP
jgi:hypothetical protein